MKRFGAMVVGAITLASVGLALASLTPPPGDPAVIELLSGMTFEPNRTQLNEVLGDDAAAKLLVLAQDDEGDPGIRIRAIRALGEYAGSDEAAAVSKALAETLAGLLESNSGVETLYLRACARALAKVGGEGSVAQIEVLLYHPSRDVRAAGAESLGITGSNGAVAPLRQRALVEEVAQVQIAIERALQQIEDTKAKGT